MLKFTGIGSAYHPELGSNSAYLIKENSLYIFDCGESVFGRMKGLEIDFQSLDRIVFLITHTHSDHIGSLAGFVSYLSHVANQQPLIVHPTETIPLYLTLCGIKENEYVFNQSSTYHDKNMKVSFYAVNHVGNMDTFGILCQLSTDNYSFYYSGDAISLPESCLSDFNVGKIDRWYQDVTIHPNNQSHLYYERLFEKVAPERLNQLYCMHLEEDAAEILKKAGLQVAQLER